METQEGREQKRWKRREDRQLLTTKRSEEASPLQHEDGENAYVLRNDLDNGKAKGKLWDFREMWQFCHPESLTTSRGTFNGRRCPQLSLVREINE